METREKDQQPKGEKPYETPRLRTYGTVQLITRTGKGPQQDSAKGNPGSAL